MLVQQIRYIFFSVGAASGAASGAVTHRLTTGSWDGAGQATLEGAADGYMSGAISGFISGGLTSNSCFVAGTAILTSAGYVAIENIQAGDKVYAHNPDTGETALKEVVQTFVNEADELIHITVNGEEIITTNEHPFYVPVKGWTAACQLRAGDRLQLVNGEYVVVEQIQHEILESPIKVYNFEVEDFHTYYVGEQSVLVHNLCKKIGSGHGEATHKARINNFMDDLVNSNNYTEVYGNRALKSVGLKGTQRPDVIAKAKDGIYHIWEFASKSQASGQGYTNLVTKCATMKSNNPNAIIHAIIPWS